MDLKKDTAMKSGFKGLLVILFLVLSVSLISLQAYAADSSLDSSKIAALESKFPNGQYWDHLCTDVSTTRSEDYQDSVTRYACSHTESVGYYDCNHFDSAGQCWGFARKLAYEYYGVKFSSRPKSYNIDDLKAGDIVRYHPGSEDHSIWVLSVSGDTVTYVDCNYTGPCQIRWNDTTTKRAIESSLIHIEQAPDVSISLDKSSATLYLDETVTLTATVKGSDGTVTWESSDSSVASVSSSGKVAAKKAGTATITASISGKEATCSITVKNPSIKLNKSSKTMYTNGTYKLVATVEGASSKVTWRSSKSSVASVNSKGKVSAIKAGTTTITATANGKLAKCKITVKDPSTKLNVSSKSMEVGDTYTLKATVKGASSEVTWKSSKPSVASVNSKGKVSAKKAGTTTITAKANGKSAKCKVTVKKKVSSASYSMKKTDKSKTYNKKHKAEVYYNRVVLKGNSSAINKINKSIKKDMNSFLSSANVESLYDYAKSNTTDTSTTYYWTANSKVTYNKNGVISILVETYWFAGGVNNHDHYGLTYDLKTGKKLTLVDVCSGSSSSIKNKVVNKVRSKFSSDTSLKIETVKAYSAKKYNYYLKPNNKAVVCFGPYEIGYGGWYREVTIKSKYK